MAATNSLPLPLEIEGITREWLEAALSDYAPGVRVRGFAMVDLIRTTCTKIRLKLDLENNREDAPIPETAILKGGFEPHSRAMAFMHEREAKSYATLLPPLGLRTPMPYFARWDEAAQQGIVIMEDLVARGVEFCSPLRPQGFEQVARRLKDLALLHGRTWDSPEMRRGGRWDWLVDWAGHLDVYFGQFTEEATWQSYIDSPRGAAVSTEFHDRRWMREAMDRMGALTRTLPLSACHGDTHLGNLYIDTDGAPGFYDSIAHKAPAMFEVAYHIGGALDLADRPRLEAGLIQYYLDELAAHGATPPSFEAAMHQYAVYLAYGYLVFIINDSIFQPEAYNTAYAARFSQAMLDHDTKGKLARIRPG
jgi:hypothetical protein